jgi:hypothetical protein
VKFVLIIFKQDVRFHVVLGSPHVSSSESRRDCGHCDVVEPNDDRGLGSDEIPAFLLPNFEGIFFNLPPSRGGRYHGGSFGEPKYLAICIPN